MKIRNIIILIAVTVIFGVCFIGAKGTLVENLEIPIGVGADIETDSTTTSYLLPFAAYSFDDDTKITSSIHNGKGKSLAETRDDRQLRSGKKSMIGLNRIFVFSELSANIGVKNHMDILLNNQNVNDRAVCAVCKGTAADMLDYKIKGYSSSSEFIEGLIKNLQQNNFFKMQFTIIDLIVRMDAEGRNAILPYLEIKDNTIEATGLAIFRGDKMVGKADMSETRIINILKESNVNGILTLQSNSSKYINCYTNSKRKVKCYKKAGKYNFVIDLDMKGNVVTNGLYENLKTDPQVLKKFEDDMKNHVEYLCNNSVSKIKCAYKTDILDLGRIAMAKYGRNTGTDWNKAVCESNIQINVKFKVDTEGRGNY